MAILTIGAFRYSGLDADIPSLPLNIEAGAIFDATDTVRKFVFDGLAWVEFVSGTGEANTGANVGVGTGLVFRDKLGVTLNFKSLIGGTNILVTDNADDITISTTGASPLTTKGDLFGFTTVDARLPVGTDGQILSANSASAIGLTWIDDVQEVFTWTANHDANGFALEDPLFADPTDNTKTFKLSLVNMTTSTILTLLTGQTTTQTLVIPDITQADSLVTEKFAQTLASKTLDLPFIADFTNATHDHSNAAGGGQLTNSALVSGVFSAITGLGTQSQALVMGGFDVSGVGILSFDDVNTSIQQSGTTLQLDVATGGTFDLRFNNITNYIFDAPQLTLSLGTNLELKPLGASGYIDMGEITTPANPAVDVGRIYVKDESSVTTLFFRDNAGTETNLLAGGAAATFQPAYQFAVSETNLLVETIDNVWRVPIDFTSLSSITAYVEAAPTSSDITILVKKNGTTEATVIISPTGKTGSTSSFNTGSFLTTDEITVEITTVGSSVAGSNLKLSIIDGLQTSTKSIQFAATEANVDVDVGTIPDVWRTPTTITTITEINAYLEVAPVGSAMIILVKKDGVTEGTVTIADGSKVGSTAVLTSGTIDFTNEITVEVTQVGSTTAGQNLKVNILGV